MAYTSKKNEFSTILRDVRILQHYLVYRHCNMDSYRLTSLRKHQQHIRAVKYTHLWELLEDICGIEYEAKSVRVGRLFVISSTCGVGDRYTRKKMFNNIKVSNDDGKLDKFLSMMCNPHWPEMKHSILPGQKLMDIPYLFEAYVRSLSNLLQKIIPKFNG